MKTPSFLPRPLLICPKGWQERVESIYILYIYISVTLHYSDRFEDTHDYWFDELIGGWFGCVVHDCE